MQYAYRQTHTYAQTHTHTHTHTHVVKIVCRHQHTFLFSTLPKNLLNCINRTDSKNSLALRLLIPAINGRVAWPYFLAIRYSNCCSRPLNFCSSLLTFLRTFVGLLEKVWMYRHTNTLKSGMISFLNGSLCAQVMIWVFLTNKWRSKVVWKGGFCRTFSQTIVGAAWLAPTPPPPFTALTNHR